MTALDDGAEAPRLLLVEDDRLLAEMLTEILRAAGYLVDAARDGQSGLHLGLTHSYDVIVLDRGLPAIDGLDLLGRLRSRGVVTPVLVLSALGLPRDRVDGLDAGAEDYLAKPFDLEELRARLRALLRRSPAARNGSSAELSWLTGSSRVQRRRGLSTPTCTTCDASLTAK